MSVYKFLHLIFQARLFILFLFHLTLIHFLFRFWSFIFQSLISFIFTFNNLILENMITKPENKELNSTCLFCLLSHTLFLLCNFLKKFFNYLNNVINNCLRLVHVCTQIYCKSKSSNIIFNMTESTSI